MTYYKQLKCDPKVSGISLQRLISPKELRVIEELAIELRLSGVNLLLDKPALVELAGIDRISIIDDVISLMIWRPEDIYGHIIGMKLVVPNEDLVPDLFSQLRYLERQVVFLSEPVRKNLLLSRRELPETGEYILETHKMHYILKFRIGRLQDR
ncbi:MAG: hypothetical protein D6732_24180 [Methanobacteriota archaeon]|nr:MAG: hypothetical protein D6732_24180 [Euryarchaeota archaeon]